MIAAIEQFLRDTAPLPAEKNNAPSPWVATARLEGVVRDPSREPWSSGVTDRHGGPMCRPVGSHLY